MTDKETLFLYRLNQAEETLIEAEKMITNNFSPRTIINRAYYSMFYALLALFLKTGINIKTSKHIGIISLFDKEFIFAFDFYARLRLIIKNYIQRAYTNIDF